MGENIPAEKKRISGIGYEGITSNGQGSKEDGGI